MPYEFLDDAPTADLGFRCWGDTLAACFAAAAEATLSVMIESPGALRPAVTRAIDVRAPELELALLRFLEELVFYKDAHQLLLAISEVAVEQLGDEWHVRACARGERIDPSRHELGLDVKAVTLHQLRVEQTGDGWQAQVVLDV